MHTKKQKHYDIFISYRQDGGFGMANLIAEKLRTAGYSVFFDVEALRSGKFNEQLYAVIERCKDFILVLPEGGLDRCVNPEDWVRKEVLHAMKHEKNIIPVRLRNFKWPLNLPEELSELPNYQSIFAGEVSLFDASVQKLKSYLRSRPSVFGRFARAGAVAGVILLLLAAAFVTLRQMAVPVCHEQASVMTVKMTKVDLLTKLVEETGNEWNAYYGKYKKGVPYVQKNLSDDMRRRITHARKELARWRTPDSPFVLNPWQQILLRIRGVDIADLEAFHNVFYPDSFAEVTRHLDLMEEFLDFDDGVPEISVENNNLNIEYSKHGANLLYYGYMGILSTMPEKARKTYFDNAANWAYFPTAIPNVDFSREPSFYELRMESELAALERITNSVAFLTTRQLHELNKANAKMEKMKAPGQN